MFPDREAELTMMNIELGEDSEPLNTHFVLTLLEGKRLPKILWEKSRQDQSV